MTIGVTPQVRDSWRQTFSVVAQLMMSLSGRYLASILAEVPDLVTVTMALAFRSSAVVQEAWQMALVMSVSVSRELW